MALSAGQKLDYPRAVSKEDLRQLRGPVFPIPTPFSLEGEVDYSALEKYIDFLISKGAGALMVTIGTSWFPLLTRDEMLQVNKTVVTAANKRALTIVTTPPSGPTKESLAFVEHASQIGADAILGFFPERYYSDEMVVNYFSALAHASEIPVLVHEMPIRAGVLASSSSVQYSPDLLQKIFENPNVIGMKEESNETGLQYHFLNRFAESQLVIGGAGGMRSQLRNSTFGQNSYLVGVGNFVPEVELRFFQALEDGAVEQALKIVRQEEEPFFQLAVQYGWHLSLKEALDIAGVLPAGIREPIGRLPVEQRDALRDCMLQQGWIS